MKLLKSIMAGLVLGTTTLPVLMSPAEASIDSVAKACTWDFGRTTGYVIAKNITLSSGGSIRGYSHPNEDSWGVKNGNIVFYNKDRRVMTSFDKATVVNGKLVLSGRFLGNGNITHTITCQRGR